MPMKTIRSASDLQLAVIDPSHPRWLEAIHLVRERYQQAFDARLITFMPAYLALLDHDEMKSVCGFRVAQQEPLFLEQYLDQPADEILSQRFDCRVSRSALIEFGQLASFGRGLSALHFTLIAQQLVDLGYEWCVFTATDPLHALMRRFGLQPTLIAKASASCIPNANQIWGSYYQHSPRILAGNLAQGLALLNRFHLNQKQA
ncbi:delta-VPH [Vibrio anguillarum]|uniref:Delta-VPH n=3 Tax=Vibrio TaxID=662 RepID=A0A1E5FJ69_VIBAN|nr:Delta-VPH [Vibrio anguillarum 775]AGU57324.1 thermostable hemolysin [Vibrio anguillarum M3]AQP35789.1 delta-VPH [Vibrio anguillarum]MDF9390398.1 delta-VPH [Vibrio sp. 1151_11]NAW91399.1 delta-VPH [Vibrio sp. V24_P1S3T111]NAX45107.1 delta-VPH [Vibrio sp. V25_P4S6T154]NNN46431.1 delta-VPH [Vibrio sp. 2-2(8)]NNN98945.1 delta-VPH [Vibrio sp. B1-2]OEE37025.1 delta-VPH [Vibrio ordalii FS-238]OXX19104.1 delta-VPH [Vibrio sp. V06_P1A73T115]OXX24536.1 delta-VPH [Vibrio sp. V05_P4A8T149]OXX2761